MDKILGKTFDPAAISRFAKHYGFHYSEIDYEMLIESALVDMESGLKGLDSSLAMIPSYIKPAARKRQGKTVIALDAGGTNLRAALVTFDESGRAVTLKSQKVPMPGTEGRLEPDEFFGRIAEVTAPLIESSPCKIEGIGFCFSYPVEINKDADGILLAFSKEVDAPGVIGKAIGLGLKEALAKMKLRVPDRIVLLNDTSATLLSACSETADGSAPFENCRGIETAPVLGFILGTGINIAYPETVIPKIGFNSPCAPQIVVCETGNFAHGCMGILDKEFDSTTKNPGTYTLEKLTSGAYLGPLTFHIMRRALSDGLFSFRRAGEFISLGEMRTKDLNAFMREPVAGKGLIGEFFGSDERDAVSSFIYISSIITERAAMLSAAMLSAVVEKTRAGFEPFVPVRVAVEGTTFLIYRGMRSALESYLHIMLNKENPRSYLLFPVEQASLAGAAAAALPE